MIFPGFVGPTYESASLNADAQRAVNLIPELVESGSGLNKYVYYGAPGKHTFATLPNTPVRGLWPGDNRLFAAAGSKLYEVFSDATYTELGDIGSGSGPVQMFPNGNQLFVVAGDQAYIHNGVSLAMCMFSAFGAVVSTTNVTHSVVSWVGGDHFDPVTNAAGSTIAINGVVYTVLTYTDTTHLTLTSNAGTQTSVTSALPVRARTGAFLDGYFIAAEPDGKKFFLSAINNGSSWDPLDFFTKEGYPDNIAAILADHEELWLIGFETTEAWRNEGDADFTFQRDPGAFNHMGTGSVFSAVRLENGPAWLAGDGRGKIFAVKAVGFMPKRISTHAIESKWESYSTVLDAESYSYYERGHWQWVISFPTANATWCYDDTSGLWHERAWWNGSALQRDRGHNHAYVFGKHFVGDWENGKIYQQSMAIYDDFGGDRKYIRTAPHVQQEAHRIFTGRLQLNVEAGTGNVTLRVSNDAGHTYNAAKTADWSKRVIWRRLGESRDRVFEVSFTTQLKVAIQNAYLGHVIPGEE